MRVARHSRRRKTPSVDPRTTQKFLEMNMTDQIGFFDAIYTQRAIRHLKPDPVPRETIERLIRAGTKAPSGGNSQGWKFIVITDPETKSAIAEYYLQAWEMAYGNQNPSPPNIQSHVRSSADYLARNMADMPVLLMACIHHDGSPSTITRGSSIYPAVQNILLAARALGLGSAITTLHKRYEKEIKDLLGIPDNVETAALLPIGFIQEGYKYGPTRRAPVSEVTYWEKWDES
ncbi:MAG TPA: nitroreductase [Dehalococcoidia bacterium]|nr:nitroreductase [Dehalococcoidia bacterium]